MPDETNRIEIRDAVNFIDTAKSIAVDTEKLWKEQGLSPKKVKSVRYDFESDTISVD